MTERQTLFHARRWCRKCGHQLPSFKDICRWCGTGHPSMSGSLCPDAQERARFARREHRTVTDVAPERDGVAFEGGKRLTDTFQYRSRCMCGWVGPTLPTAGEASATGVAHRGEKIAEACRG